MSKELLVGYYDGQNIKSKIQYYCPNNNAIKRNISSIQFMGGMSADPNGKKMQMLLYIRFIDGTNKSFLCDQNEDGSFPPDSLENALKKADEWLSEYNF